MSRFTTAFALLAITSGLALAQPVAERRAITLPAGKPIQIRLAQSLDTRRHSAGTVFLAHVAAPVVQNGVVILPKGTQCRGHVVESKASGRLKGRAVLSVRLDSVELNGRRYEIDTSSPVMVGTRHKKRNLALIGGGTGTGAAIGAIAGGGVGAAIGAGVGAAAGTTTAFVTGKKHLYLPPETRMTFRLRRPFRLHV
jgi:hypothetical protein